MILFLGFLMLVGGLLLIHPGLALAALGALILFAEYRTHHD